MNRRYTSPTLHEIALAIMGDDYPDTDARDWNTLSIVTLAELDSWLQYQIDGGYTIDYSEDTQVVYMPKCDKYILWDSVWNCCGLVEAMTT